MVLATQSNAVLWDLSGMSVNRMALLLRVSAHAVRTWIRDRAKDYDEKPEPRGHTIVLPPDAMWHSLRKKRCKRWLLSAVAWVRMLQAKPIMGSKSTEMVDLTMALFAKCWVNGNQDALLFS